MILKNASKNTLTFPRLCGMPRLEYETPEIRAARAALYPETASGVLRKFSNASTHLEIKTKIT